MAVGFGSHLNLEIIWKRGMGKKGEMVRNFLAHERGGECTTFGKSVLSGRKGILNTNMGPVFAIKV